MADNIARTMQFEYKMNSNLVLTADRTLIDRRSKDEPTGEVLPIKDIDPKKMGSKVLKRKPDLMEEKQSKRARRDQSAKTFDQNTESITGSSDVAQKFNYIPKTAETKSVYEAILNIVSNVLPEAEFLNITQDTTDELLTDLKNTNLSDKERKRAAKSLLGSTLTDTQFNSLINLSAKLTDYKPPKSSRHYESVDDANDLNIEIDDDKEEEESDVYGEVQDSESEEEGVEADTNTTLNISQSTAGTISQIPGTSTVLPCGGYYTQKNILNSEKLNANDIDAFWLQRTLSKHFTDPNECQKRTKEILEVLKVAKNEQELENKLIRIVGVDRFDLVRMFRENRSLIYYCTKLSSAQTAEERNRFESEMKSDPKLNRILVELRNYDRKEDIVTAERNRKTQVRSAKIQADIDMEDLSILPNYGNVDMLDLKNITFTQGSHLMTNKNCALPDGSYRKTKPGYNLVCVPAPKPKPLDADENLVKISDLPSYVKAAFEKIKTLNRIQSKVYKTALETDENILLCAPTGAGKTNVALLAMMREIGKHINTDGTIRKEDFKIVYVAPMKSLVSEMAASFGDRLKSYNLKVSMLSGDSHLSREEIQETQIIVCTPEKWDIISRKSSEKTYTQLVKLLIFDEIHLLHDERGPVLEAIIARTIRAMQSSHSNIDMRIVGLSATLPNTEDISDFIHVDKHKGLFKFDSSYRPVPMDQEFLGINERKPLKRIELMNDLVYEKVMEYAGKHQVLIFVHSRKETANTAKAIKEKCLNRDTLGLFLRDKKASTLVLQQDLDKVKNHDLKDLLPYGFAIHHAGLAYTDRNFVEELFTDKHIQVLVSTSTLAWGVNLPAHVVIIKGTQIYRADKGAWAELSALDVMQMFGRAGRPQYDTKGVGVMITNESELTYYLSLLNEQLPIESQFISKLADNLNAEIVMGSVRNIQEAIEWLRFTYLYIRMRKNPTLYGVETAFSDDPTLENHCKNLIYTAASILERAEMINFDKRSGEFLSNEIGRIAAYYYCCHETMETLKSLLKKSLSDIEVFKVFSKCSEFCNISVREEDKMEIKKLLENVPIPIKEGAEDPPTKINCLLQAYISQLKLERFTLSSDTVYISNSAARLMRAMFEVALSKRWANLTGVILETCKEIEQRMWACSCPLRQFKKVPWEIIKKLEKKNIPFDRLIDQKHHELGELVNNHKMGKTIYKFIHQIPKLELKTHLQPITRSTLKVELTITPDFDWCPKSHGSSQGFWIFVEDVMKENILHYEYFLLKEKFKNDDHILKFYIPIYDPLPPLYFIRAVSDKWIASENEIPINLFELLLPEKNHPLTELLDLQRLPIKALRNEDYESIYKNKMSFFNAIQTQCFESLYNSDENVFIGAPTGSGKTVCAEFAMMRLFSNRQDARCVYVTALEDLAQIRYKAWLSSFGNLGKTVIKLTGNMNMDTKSASKAHIIVSTADNWDLLSRRWKKRRAVQNIQLFIADDLHLIGSQHNGTTLEVVCSRTRYMSSQLENPIRIIALSYSLTNAKDVGEWLDCHTTATYNFNPSVRHRPLDIEVQTFNITHNATRLAAMSKPVYQTILKSAPNSPVIVFVPTMKQTESIAFLLMGYALSDKKNFGRASESIVAEYMRHISNEILIETLSCGVGFIHEALSINERNLMLELFSTQSIQILVVSHSLCWSIPSDAYLVIVMDTQVYNGKDCMYDDYSAVDLIQMVGRANNVSFDDAKSVIMCQTNKKDFIHKFLHEPIPLESHLNHQLHDHFNAEIVTTTIENKQDAVDYLTWTFLYHRMTRNPNYYNLKGITHRHLSDHLSELVENTLTDLYNSKCIAIKDDIEVSPINQGMIATFYYIRYTTIEMFSLTLRPNSRVRVLLDLICNADEFEDLPLRHGEDVILSRIKQVLRLPISEDKRLTDPRTKANILLQAHLSRVPIKAAELKEDLNQILMKSVRLIQAVVDVLSSSRWLGPALAAMELAQMITQAQWHRDSILKQIPHFDNPALLERCEQRDVKTVLDLLELGEEEKVALLDMPDDKLRDVAEFLQCYPNIELNYDPPKTVNPGGQIELKIQLNRDTDNVNSVCARYFPYKREENWWLVVGEPNQGHLITIKLLGSHAEKSTLEFEAPRKPGSYDYTLYFMSDSYLGCDQEYKFTVNVV